MKTVIIEDEPLAAKRLAQMIHEIDQGIVIENILDSIDSSISWFKNNPPPDLIFLDIHLADGLSFKIFEQIEIKSPVIFCTAYDEYAIKAFHLNSIDYLLKPVEKEKLAASIRKFKEIKNYYSTTNFEFNLQNLLKEYQIKKSEYKSRFLVNKGSNLIPLTTHEIAYFYAEDKLVLLRTFSNQIFVINYSLEQLETLLDPKMFFRINRGVIISNKSIINIHNYFNYKLKLETEPKYEKELIVSKQRTNEFKEWLNA